MACPKCNYTSGRDIIAVINLEKIYLQMGGTMLFALKPCEVGVKLMNPAQRVKPLPTTRTKTKIYKMNE